MILRTSFLCLVSVLCIALWYISPIIKPFPPLTGTYAVGLETLYFTNQQQAKLLETADTSVAIVGHMFFPADDNTELAKSPYFGFKKRIFLEKFSAFFGLPKWVTQLLFRNIVTHAYADASVSLAKKSYPVVLFSHGLLGSSADMYSVLLAELASHGYIVIGLDHPYFNWVTLSSDGTAVDSDALARTFEKMSPMDQKEFQTQAIGIYKRNIGQVLDQLTILNQDKKSKLYHRLDLDRVGLLGHSAGGTASLEFCRNDNRCKAVIDLDGWYDQVIGYEPLKQPTLLIFGSKSVKVSEPTAEYLKRKELSREEYFKREQNIAEHRRQFCASPLCSMIVLPDVAHGDFGDSIFLKWPLRSWHDADSYKTINQINERILNFLNQHLR